MYRHTHTGLSMYSNNMAGSDLYHVVDEFYFSLLHDHDEVFPISDEKYALELQLQEALMSSSAYLSPTPTPPPPPPEKPLMRSGQSSAGQSSVSFCDICMDTKPMSEMFRNTNVCGHTYCSDCISKHVAAKIQENITMVRCPDLKCKGVIGPEICHSIVPKQVLERWESALCESLILGSQKFYCPFIDCLAMLVDEGEEKITIAECPHCRRLFCAECKVAWHSGLECSEFQILKKSESGREDVLLMELAKNKKWRRCPSCKFFVEKLDGCQHISCRCGYQFCYGCGKNYTGSHVCTST